MDLAIAVDTSNSITEDQFEILKSAVIMLARSFGLSRRETHVAVIVYGSSANVEIHLNDHTDLESFKNAVRKIKYIGGHTRIDLALSMVSSSVFTPSGGAREGTPKVLIIMTDRRQTSAPDALLLTEAVAPLKSSGVKIFSIGIDNEVDEYELITILEEGDKVESFDTLFDAISEVGFNLSFNLCISHQLCKLTKKCVSVDYNHYDYTATHGISFIRNLCTLCEKRPVIFVKSSQYYEKIVIIHLQ